MPNEPVQFPTYVPSSLQPTGVEEQSVAALIRSDHATEAELRELGHTVEADQLKSTRESRAAEWRAAAGLPPTPAQPNPSIVAAAEHGVRLNAAATDYRTADLNNFAQGRDPERVENARFELSELMASLKIDVASGKFIMEHVANEGPKVAAMTPEARSDWIWEQERLLARSAQIRGTTVEKLKENAKAMLGDHHLGAAIANSALLSSPTILLTLFDHQKAIQAWKRK